MTRGTNRAAPHVHHVLVVEDDPGIRALVADVLLDEGYTVEVAHDVPSALRALDRAPARVCLVLLDVMLPGGDGVAVLAHQRAAGRRTPVVALSASAERLAAARRAGATGTIGKPFELEQLVGAVARCCRS